MKFRKKPVVIEATQWFKNGDHPMDCSHLSNGDMVEGSVVRYFRHPLHQAFQNCEHCGEVFHDHGWIDTLEGGHIVCPSDWIITGVKGEHYPCKPDIFEMTYEAVK